MVMQLTTWPWKTPLINLADGAMSMMPLFSVCPSARVHKNQGSCFSAKRRGAFFSKVHPAACRRGILPGSFARQAALGFFFFLRALVCSTKDSLEGEARAAASSLAVTAP